MHVKKNIYRQLTIVAVCSLLVIFNLVIPVRAESTGNCGNGVSWNLNNGILKIEGNGAMDDYSTNLFAPWYEFKDEIVSIIIENNVTKIGNLAFYDCNNLGSVIIGNGVTSIGDYAFLECEKLTNVKVGSSVKSIGDASFKMCTSLQTIILPNGLESMGREAFFLCQSLTSITIPSTVIFMGECAFSYCSKLVQVNVNAGLSKLPDWTFYECNSLVNVSLPSTIEDIGADAFEGCNKLNNIGGNVSPDVTNQINNQVNDIVKNEPIDDSTSIVPSTPNGNTQEVIENEDIILNGTIQGDDVTIDAIINTDKGWQTIIDKVEDYEVVQEVVGNDTSIDINISVSNDDKVSGDLLTDLAGKDVNIVIKGDNIQFEINGKDLVIGKNYKDFKIEYDLEEIIKANKAVKKAIGDAKGFYLKFKSNVDFNVTVKILLGPEYSYSIAAFYQKDGDWDLLQSVTIDGNGFASFYLNNFDIFTKYLIGIDVEDVDSGIIPDSLYDDYDGLMDAYGNRYVITGSESKWGLSVGQVTMILVAVMVITFASIGGVMLMIKKRQEAKEKIRKEVMGDIDDRAH